MSFALAGLLGPVALPAGADPWPEPPEGTRALLLLTGADVGYVWPKGCWGYHGGSLYRPTFDRWLADSRPGIRRLWVSTGNVNTVPRYDDGIVVEPERVFRMLADTGYAVVGVGSMDLERLGPAGLLDWARRGAFDLVATNLRVLETDRPLLAPSAVAEVSGRRIAFLAVLEHDPTWVGIAPDGTTVLTEDPVRAVRRELARLASGERPPDDVVLLSTLLQGSLRTLLRAVSGIDLVAASSSTYYTREEILLEGHRVLWLGNWGRRLGVVPLTGDGPPGTARTVDVDDEFPVDPATGRLRPRAGARLP